MRTSTPEKKSRYFVPPEMKDPTPPAAAPIAPKSITLGVAAHRLILEECQMVRERLVRNKNEKNQVFLSEIRAGNKTLIQLLETAFSMKVAMIESVSVNPEDGEMTVELFHKVFGQAGSGLLAPVTVYIKRKQPRACEAVRIDLTPRSIGNAPAASKKPRPPVVKKEEEPYEVKHLSIGMNNYLKIARDLHAVTMNLARLARPINPTSANRVARSGFCDILRQIRSVAPASVPDVTVKEWRIYPETGVIELFLIIRRRRVLVKITRES